MQNNLIFCALAYDENLKSSVNLKKNDDNLILYLKNAFVALFSAKENNLLADIALVTNVEIDEQWKNLYESHNIKVYIREFDFFRFDSEYKWGLAFYKLCALKKMLEFSYDNYLIIDTDVYVQSNLDDLWKDTKDYLMLFDINHRPSTPHSQIFDNEVLEFIGIDRSITNWGGEFIAGNHETITEFVKKAENIYEKMIQKKIRTMIGDEFITRLVADEMAQVKNAGGYIFRFWTNTFRLVSDCYYNNEVSVLHVPNEKKYGMLEIFSYIIKKNRIPKKGYVHKVLHLKHKSFLTMLKVIAIKIKYFIFK